MNPYPLAIRTGSGAHLAHRSRNAVASSLDTTPPDATFRNRNTPGGRGSRVALRPGRLDAGRATRFRSPTLAPGADDPHHHPAEAGEEPPVAPAPHPFADEAL